MANINSQKKPKSSANLPSKTDTTKGTVISDCKNGEEYVCWGCGRKFKKLNGNFTPTNFPLFKKYGYYPVCKKCTSSFYEEMVSFFNGSEEDAIKFMCTVYGIYFNKSPLLASGKRKNFVNRFNAYLSKTQISPWCELSSLDNLRERNYYDRKNAIKDHDDICKEGTKTDLETVKFWGFGFSDDDYEFLQEQYEEWTTRCECKMKQQEEVFKRICFIQLEILKATIRGESTKDLDRTFQEYLDTANLKPKQNSLNTLSEAQTFGTLLAKWENERPLPEIDEELQDVDKIGLYIDVFFRGHLAKMMGLKGGLSNIYNNFMKKYTVKRPEYQDDEDNEALFDSIFGKNYDDK